MVRNLLIFSFLALNVFLHASVDVEVSPKESNGSPITVKFIIKNEEGTPDLLKTPESTDWRISPPFTQSSKSIRMNGLKMETDSTTSVTYFLYPLKTGQLKLPLFQIKLNERIHSTPPTTIRVTKLLQNQQQGRARNPMPGFPMFPMDEEDTSITDPSTPAEKKLDVAIVAEPSKVEVYTGELIILPFYIYTNEDIFRNLEFASFPTFKDFIKEELLLPKNWRSERVKYRGENYHKAEIIRFALFPLKEGELLIDPLNMRFEIDDSLFNLRKHFQGEEQERGNSFLRSSGSIPVVVKALPPKPAQITQENIAVGKYTITPTLPSVELVQNEPFTLKFRVEGRGNIKGIPEPEIRLPDGIQKSKTATDYSIDTMSEGYKDFDLLLVPRKSGSLIFPENSWTYFDPDKKAYETIPMPSIELKVAPSNKRGRDEENQIKPQDIVYSGKQNFDNEKESDLPWWAWSFPTVLYALAGFFFVQRRKHEKEEELLNKMPWTKVERKIYAQQDLSSNEALGLVEEWILQRFRVLNMEEAAFSDLSEELSRKVAPSSVSKVEKLREKFKLIESTRFGTGRKTNSLNMSFEEIKKLSEEIIHATQSYQAPTSEDDDD